MFKTNPWLGYPKCKTKNLWHSFDSQFQDGVGSMSLLFLPLTAGTPSFMDVCYQSLVRLPRCNIKNHWRSIDPHFQDGAGSVSPLFLPQKAANTSFMDVFNQSPLRWPKMDSQNHFPLGCCSFWEQGSDHVAVCFAYRGCQYVGYI